MSNSSAVTKIPIGIEGLQTHEVQFLLACSKGDKEKVKGLLKIVDPSYEHNQAIITLCQNGSTEIVELLLKDLRVNPAARDNEPIRWASSKGHLSIVKLLLKDNRVDPCSQKNFCLREACMENHIELIKVLLADPRIDPSDRDNAAFRYVADSGPLEVVKLLLNDERVDPSDRENEAIRKACLDGRIEVVKLLLLDSRVNPADANNEAIKFAVRNGHVDIVRLLVNDPRVEPLSLSPMVKKAKKKNLNKKPSAHMLPSKYDYLGEFPSDISEYSSAEDECTKKTVAERNIQNVAVQGNLVYSGEEFENNYPPLSKVSAEPKPKTEFIYSTVVKQPFVDSFETDSNVSASTTVTPDTIVLKSRKEILLFEEADMNYLPKPKRKPRLNKKPSVKIIPSKYDYECDMEDLVDDNDTDEISDRKQKSIEENIIPKVAQIFSSEGFDVIDPLLPRIDISAKKPVQGNYVKAAKSAPADAATPDKVEQIVERKKIVHHKAPVSHEKTKGDLNVPVLKTSKKKVRLNKKPSAYVLPSKYDYDMDDLDDVISSYSDEEYSREEIIDILTKESPKIIEKYSNEGFDVNDPLLPRIDMNNAKKVSFNFVKAAKNAPAEVEQTVKGPRKVVQRVIRTKPSFINIIKSKPPTDSTKVESRKVDRSFELQTKSEDIKEAALEGDFALVQELLQDSFVDPTINENEAICNAARNGHLDIVKILLKNNRVDPSANDCEAIIQAASKNHQEIVEALLQDPRVNPNQLITESCKKGDSNVVRSILECPRFDIQNRDCSDALIYSCWKGHVEIVDLLLKDGRFDPSDADNEAIRYAARNGYVEIAKLLLADPRVDPSARNNEAFSDATRSGHYEVVKLLYPWVIGPKTYGYKNSK